MTDVKPIYGTIAIHDHLIHCVIGVFPHEKEKSQAIAVDVEIQIDVSRSIKSDHVEDTVNYVEIAHLCTDLATKREYNLLETFAHEALEQIVKKWNVNWGRIRVKKFHAIPSAKYVSVEFYRGVKL